MARSKLFNRRARERQRGNAAILSAIMIVMLLGFGALVVDVGSLFRVRNELQNAADAAAHAGAMELDRTSDGLTRACSAAKRLSEANPADSFASRITDEDVHLGRWYFASAAAAPTGCEPFEPPAALPCFVDKGTCASPPTDSSDISEVTAVRVFTRRAPGPENKAVNLFLGAFVGRRQSNVGANAIAVGGGPVDECAFPIVVADCSIQHVLDDPDKTEEDYCAWCMSFQPAEKTGGNAAWTGFDSTPTPKVLEGLIQGTCGTLDGGFLLDDEGVCSGECNNVNAGGETRMSEGVIAADAAIEAIQAVLLRDGDPNNPKAFYVRLPVIQGMECDEDGAPEDTFSGAMPVAGFITVQIFGAASGKKEGDLFIDQEVAAEMETTPGCTPPSGVVVMGRLECDVDTNQLGGSIPYGTEAKRIVLVH